MEDDPNPGSGPIKSDEFCLVLLRSQTSSQSKSKHVLMMLGKFLEFGLVNKRSQLNLYISRDSNQYRARVTVIKVKQNSNASQDECECPSSDNTDDIVCELRNVDSSCIQPILPLTENVIDANSVVPMSQSFLKTSNLDAAFKHMTDKGKYHDCKNIIIPPSTHMAKFSSILQTHSLDQERLLYVVFAVHI